MAVETKKETGKTNQVVGGVSREIEFEFESIKDSNGDTPSFTDVCSFLIEQGYQEELPSKEQLLGLKELNPGVRRIAEPRSLTRALIYFHSQKNRQEAMAAIVDEIMNTADSVIDKAVNQLVAGIVGSRFDKVAKGYMAALLGLAEEGKMSVIAGLRRLSQNNDATDFSRNLANENIALLADEE